MNHFFDQASFTLLRAQVRLARASPVQLPASASIGSIDTLNQVFSDVVGQ
ncbi:MAG: hypothetical protein AAF708_20225 [Deinococcota bacterium]